jgi:hypothetical protein
MIMSDNFEPLEFGRLGRIGAAFVFISVWATKYSLRIFAFNVSSVIASFPLSSGGIEEKTEGLMRDFRQVHQLLELHVSS